MQHLTMEELARLVDEPPEPTERIHLDGCAECSDELQRLRRQTEALRSLPPLEAPPAVWARVEASLDGAIAPQESAARRPMRHLLRAAGYAALFLAGTAGGYVVGARGGEHGGPLPASRPTGAATAAADPAAAESRLRRAEAEYTAALSAYAEVTGQAVAMDPVSRLVALEGIVVTAGTALESAPADPVINGYFLSAVGQRDAVLRQIVQTADDGWF